MAPRSHALDQRQIAFAWTDPADLLRAVERRGELVYEAPDASRIVKGRHPKLPRVRVKRGRAEEPPSLGLPFGARDLDGRIACWSCATELEETDVVRDGPGAARCPGCGARLPFAE